MPCSATNAYGRPCGVATKKDYCHIHSKNLKDVRLGFKVVEQTKELNRLNKVESMLREQILIENTIKCAALTEVEKLKEEVQRLKDKKMSLNSKITDMISTVKASKLASKHNTKMKARINELETEVADLKTKNTELSSMKEDYDSYQTIKQFEVIHHQLFNIYGVNSSKEMSLAMKNNPAKCIDLLGSRPLKYYHELRLARNSAAHEILCL